MRKARLIPGLKSPAHFNASFFKGAPEHAHRSLPSRHVLLSVQQLLHSYSNAYFPMKFTLKLQNVTLAFNLN
jgi:hypothetical protein